MYVIVGAQVEDLATLASNTASGSLEMLATRTSRVTGTCEDAVSLTGQSVAIESTRFQSVWPTVRGQSRNFHTNDERKR